MASTIFALLDDIAVLMDDVAVMGKIATKKTAGILGDDLAVNAEKSSGFVSSREIPVLLAITKGSFINKLIILPVAFLLSAFLPWIIIPILMLGGLYLAYEGVEKIYEYFFHKKEVKIETETEEAEQSEEESLALETEKVKSAVFVDFILSIEIVIIALSTVVGKPLSIQIMVVSLVAILATVGVYGIVALIVRMDDFGYKLISLSKNNKSISSRIGLLLVNALPVIIRSLSVIGTIALILVSGGIFIHNIHYLHDLLHSLPSIVAEFIVGILIGSISLVIVSGYKQIKKSIQA